MQRYGAVLRQRRHPGRQNPSARTEGERGALGNRVSSYFVDLPVGEPNPVVRLHQVSYEMRGLKDSGQSVDV